MGGSGEGKSTIMNLITGFYDIQKGKILLDGKSINSLTEESLRNAISVVPQSPYIFNLSIKENLKLAKPSATDAEIEDACKKAYIHDFIETLPEKNGTVVGEGGVTLSGGQKQRVSIARALIRRPSILILDEATSSIDTLTEIRVQKAFAEMMKGKTSFVVAHRLSTIKDSDVILVMRDGNIVEQGKHDELLEKGGFYAELYNSQFEA